MQADPTGIILHVYQIWRMHIFPRCVSQMHILKHVKKTNLKYHSFDWLENKYHAKLALV